MSTWLLWTAYTKMSQADLDESLGPASIGTCGLKLTDGFLFPWGFSCPHCYQLL